LFIAGGFVFAIWMKRVYSRENTFLYIRVSSAQPTKWVPNINPCHANLDITPSQPSTINTKTTHTPIYTISNTNRYYIGVWGLITQIIGEGQDNAELVRKLSEVLGRWNLKVNTDKTEYIKINRDNMKEISIRKLGNLFSSEKDIPYRISFANSMLRSLHKLWKNTREVSEQTKIDMYKACIMPIMTYNIGANGAGDRAIVAFDKAQRKHLKIICGIFDPVNIKNRDLYGRTGVEPV
jgi:hypothetical protein